MAVRKKILILYASAGHGHEKAAKAVLEELSQNFPEAEAEILDTVSLSPGFFGELYRQTYLVQIKYAPWLWGVFYYSFDVPWIYFFMKFIRRAMNAVTSARLVLEISNRKPDVIFTTHFYSSEVVSHLKEKNIYCGKLVTLVTDYMAHHVWIAKNTDLYCVASQATREDLIRRGVSPASIQITGIPASKIFSKSVSIQESRHKLGLEGNRFTVLLTSGGVGISTIGEITRGLLEKQNPPQILVVCGTNQKLQNDLANIARNKNFVKIYGFVSNMDELMAASDLVVGKAGGLTVTEAFLKSKPMILYRSIPGQEARNAWIAEKAGAAFVTDKAHEVMRMIFLLMRDKSDREKMSAASGALSKPSAAKDIAAFLCGL